MIAFRIEKKGVEETRARIEKRIFALTGKDPAMLGEIQKAVASSTAANFVAQGRPRWAKRSPAYEKKATWSILRKTGKLLDSVLDSIQRPWDHQGKSHFLNIYSVFYGFFHEYGKSQKIRRFVSLTITERKHIPTIVKRYMRGK